MWTHLQPHLKSQLTTSSISKRARVEVFRSLNLRRLIAFTGSGATSSYGLPDWDDLARIFVEATLDEISETSTEVRQRFQNELQEIEPLLTQLGRLLRKNDVFDLSSVFERGGNLAADAKFPDDKTVVMDLCEEILRVLPNDPESGQTRTFKVRAAFAQHFRKSTNGLLLQKWKGFLDESNIEEQGDVETGADLVQISNKLSELGHERADDARTTLLSPDLHLACLLHCLEKETSSEQREAAREVAALLAEAVVKASTDRLDLPLEHHMGPILDRVDRAGMYDISDVLTRELKVARIATLNYDVQIERSVLRQTGNLPGVDTEGFVDLCKDWETKRPHTKRLIMENLLQRGAVSITLGPENVGDIVNFSAYSRQYGNQILHLHGRFDDAENLVLTKRDYDRLYMTKALPRMIFREAQEMLFGGNDILILGIGMSEDDVVRPFRRLMARNDHERANTRRVFLLKARTSCIHCSDDGTCETCERKDEVETLNNMMRYQIHTLLFGGKVWRATMSRFRIAEDALNAKGGSGADRQQALEALHAFFEENAKSTLNKGAPGEKLLLPWEIAALRKAANANLDDGFAKAAVNAMTRELKGRVMSRALVKELRELNENKGEWWDAWRRSPFERRAIYHQYVPDTKDQGAQSPNYLWLRHCPANVPELGDPANWGQLEQARLHAKAAETEGRLKREGGRWPGSRVLRLTAGRGSGKGSLIRLLMHRDAQNHVFPPDSRGQNSYEAAFMAHQSFSMEFSSVAKALTRFLARQAAEIMLKRMDAEVTSCESNPTRKALDRIIAEELMPAPYENSGSSLRLTGKAILRQLAPADLRIIKTMKNSTRLVCDLDEDSVLKSSEFRDIIARRLYVVRREDEPRLIPYPEMTKAEELEHEVVRKHRLEVLRTTMEELERLSTNRDERFFICLSGLDRICDSKGDARNPMHRALFRLLCGTTDRDKPDPDPPIDYLFLAGRPQTPIAFLSEEYIPAFSGDEPATEHLKAYSNETRTERFLKKWQELPAPTWEERLRLSCSEDRRRAEGSLRGDEAFLAWAKRHAPDRTDNRYDELHGTREIRRGLWGSVAMTLIVLRGWSRLVTLMPPDATASDLRQAFREYIEPLDRGFARDGDQGVLAAVLATHERIDREEERKTLDDVIQDDEKKVTLDPMLIRLILRHLVLFRLPVEIWVLMGCPLIYRHLRERFESEFNLERTGRPVDDFRERWFILDSLSYHLKELCRRCLVIEIEPSQNSEDGAAGTEDHERRLHMRYALHAGLREYFAYHMQLQISDEGDLNHHQMSVFCDQPRDLPTPGPAHFEMIGGIVSHMIERSRVMLDATYRTTWSGKQYKRTPWDERPGSGTDDVTREALRRAAEHVFFPAEDQSQPILKADGIAGSMGQIHAVPQRLRACFSMLQTALTVGSLSRLDTVDLKPGDEPPFEVYRGWLRGLLNAAVGLERNRKELGLLLDGSVFRTGSADGRGGDSSVALGLAELVESIEADPDLSRKKRNKELINSVASNMREIRYHARSGGLMNRQRTKYKVLRQPFYRDEIAWLYNERGLTSFMQGRLFDAIPLFKQARFIMAHAQTPPFDSKAYNAAERRINLNLALAYIERGKIDIARRMLTELEVSLRNVKRSTPSKVHGFARGYLAFCDHLSGSFEGALSEYEACLKGFIERRDLRAISIFNRLMGDLYFRTGQHDDARARLEMAVNSAAQAQQRDVENHALLSLAVFEVGEGATEVAQGRIRRVLLYAKQMGLYRLEAEAHLAEGKLNLKRGELGLAAEAVARSIAMSSRHGLRLIKLGGLVDYGKIQFFRAEYSLAHNVLEEAKREAETLGFQLEASEAANILARISPMLRSSDLETMEQY